MPNFQQNAPFSKISDLRAQRTKSRGPKGLQLEVEARRAPRLLVIYIFISTFICSFSTFSARFAQLSSTSYWMDDRRATGFFPQQILEIVSRSQAGDISNPWI